MVQILIFSCHCVSLWVLIWLYLHILFSHVKTSLNTIPKKTKKKYKYEKKIPDSIQFDND